MSAGTEWKVRPLLVRANHPNAFRSGQFARIIGLVAVRPSGAKEMRHCYHVMFDDGACDYWSMGADMQLEFMVQR
jgi:hypothetical protein